MRARDDGLYLGSAIPLYFSLSGPFLGAGSVSFSRV